jgi:HEAT repeat protein
MKQFLALSTCVFLFGSSQIIAQPVPIPKGPIKRDVGQFIEDLDSKDINVRINAAVGLAEFGPKAAPAVPKLIAALQNADKDVPDGVREDLRLNAALALGKIGAAAVKPLITVLDTNNDDHRYYAVWALGWIGPDAKPAAAKVIAALSDKNDGVRRKAAFTLGRIGADPNTAIAELAKVLQDKVEDVRKAAAEGLSKYGDKAVPTLIGVLEKGEKDAQVLACFSLGEIGSDAAKAIPALSAILTGKNEGTAEFAASALAKIGKAAVPTFTEALKDERPIVRQIVLRHVAQMQADGVGILVDGLGDKRVDVRRVSAELLAPMRITDKSVVIALGFALKDDDDQVRVAACSALQNMGAGAKLAAPYLQNALSDFHPQVRISAYYALSSMNENPQKGFQLALTHKDIKVRVNTASLMVQVNFDVQSAFPILRDALGEKDLALRMQAAHALAQRRQDSEKCLPIFIDGLKHEKSGVRGQALQGLQMLGPQASAAKDVVFDVMLKDPEAQLRQQAIWTFRNMVQGNVKAHLPLLEKMVKADNAQVRVAAVQMLGGGGEAAVPLLLDLMQDKDENVRGQAAQSMRNVGPAGKKAAPQLLKMAEKDGNANNRLLAVYALLGQGAESVTMLIDAAKKSMSSELRTATVQGISNWGIPFSKDAVPFLVECLQSKEASVSSPAVNALARQGNEGRAALLDNWKSVKDDNTRATLVTTLWNYGAWKNDKVVPLCLETLKGPNAQGRWMSALILGQIGKTAAKEVVPALVTALGDDDSNVRSYTINALNAMGEQAHAALIGALKKENSTLRQHALQVLASQRYKSKEGLASITATLKDKSPGVRASAANVLAQFGPDAKSAIPALEALVEDGDANVRRSVQAALKVIKGKEK